MTPDEASKFILKLMPLWVLLLVVGAASMQSAYGLDILTLLAQPWIEALFISIGLGGMPYAAFKRLVEKAQSILPVIQDLPSTRT